MKEPTKEPTKEDFAIIKASPTGVEVCFRPANKTYRFGTNESGIGSIKYNLDEKVEPYMEGQVKQMAACVANEALRKMKA